MSNQVDLAVPASTLYDSNTANGAVDCIGRSNVVTVGRPAAPPEVCRQRRVLKRDANRGFQDEVVDHVVLGCVWRWRGVAEDLDSPVIACRGKELVGRIERNAFDVALMYRQRLEFLKRMPRPHNNLGIETDGHEERVVRGPGEVLHIVVVAHKSLVRLPVLDWGRFVRTKGGCVRWRVAVEMVDADDLVVGAGSEIAAVG